MDLTRQEASFSSPSGASAGSPSRLDSLTGLRFAAALAVFGLHLEVLFPFAPYGGLTRLVSQGGTGVSFFFLLSGFVLTWSYRPHDSSVDFYRRRFARIYPLHALTWVAMGVVLVTLATTPSGGPALGSLLLLSPWAPSFHYSQAMNVPAWSLGCEAFFYALFPVLVRAIGRLSGVQRRLVLGGAVVAVLGVAALCAPATYGTTGYWLLYFFPPTRLVEFVIGIVLAYELRAGGFPRLPLVPVALVAGGAYVAAGWAPWSMRPVAVTLVPFSALIVAAAQRDCSNRPSFWSSRALVALGGWSYAFYIVHFPLMTATALMLTRHGVRVGTPGAVALAAGMLLVTTMVSAGLHRWFERPLERRLRGRGRRHHGPRLADSPREGVVA